MIAIPQEFDLDKVAEMLPRRDGKKPHKLTVKRWIKRGIGGVRLRARRSGRSWFVTLEAIEEFRDATTAGALAEPAATEPTTSGKQVAAQRKVSLSKLQENGFDVSQKSRGRKHGKQLSDLRTRGEEVAGSREGAVSAALLAVRASKKVRKDQRPKGRREGAGQTKTEARSQGGRGLDEIGIRRELEATAGEGASQDASHQMEHCNP